MTRQFLPLEAPPREALLLAVRQFVKEARVIPGVAQIALVGSLTTNKTHPKDADVLVTIPDDADLVRLAVAGRRLKGAAQRHNCGADIFIVNMSGDYRGRICHWRDCRPGIRASCDARHCGQRPHLHDDLDDVQLDATLIREPPIVLWPIVCRRGDVPRDVDEFLLGTG